jgi:hypothetical protein
MATSRAIQLKKEIISRPACDFEHFTFDDLEIGQRFIEMPEPCRIDGEPNFKNTLVIFRKIEKGVRFFNGWAIDDTNFGLAAYERDGLKITLPRNMRVIRVE